MGGDSREVNTPRSSKTRGIFFQHRPDGTVTGPPHVCKDAQCHGGPDGCKVCQRKGTPCRFRACTLNGETRGEWWVRYCDQYGQPHREKVGPKGLAKEVYQKRKIAIREGKFFPEQIGKQRVTLFDELAKDFLTYAKMHKRSHADDARRMRRILVAFGGKPAKAVTAEDVDRFKGSFTDTLAPATVNRHLALLRSVYYLGIRNRKVEHNPMRGVKLFQENNARVRYVTEEEEFRLFQTLPKRYHALVEVGLLTGLRASNLLGLRWRDVDLEAKVYTVPQSKSGDALRLPMHSLVKEILKGLPRNGAYVFAKADGEPPWDFTHTFAAAVKRAGIQDLHLHDLRHTWASRMAMAGVDLLTIKELGGWKTLSMVTRYAHLSPDHKRAALGRLISYRIATTTDTRQETGIVADQAENGNYLKVLVPGAGVEPA